MSNMERDIEADKSYIKSLKADLEAATDSYEYKMSTDSWRDWSRANRDYQDALDDFKLNHGVDYIP